MFGFIIGLAFLSGLPRGLDGHAVAIADDFNILGSPAGVCKAFSQLQRLILDSGLAIRSDKCGLLWPRLPPVPQAIQDWASLVRIPVHEGSMESLGAPVGAMTPFTTKFLAAKVASHAGFFELLSRPDLSVQVALLLLRLSTIPAMGYLSRVIHPSRFGLHAAAFDQQVIGAVVQKLGLPSPISNVALNTLALPIRLGGFGLRSVHTTSPVAFWSALASSASDIASYVLPRDRVVQLVDPVTRSSLANELFNCHSEIKRRCPDVPPTVLPPDPADFWQLYGDNPPPRGLQRSTS